MHGLRAFTLVELLLVVAIIVILIALLQPSLQTARKHAWTVRCLANQHAIGVGTNSYAAGNNYFVARDAWYNNNDPTDTVNYAHYSMVGRYSEHMGGPVVPIDNDDSDAVLIAAAKATGLWRCPAVDDTRYALTYASNGVDFLYYKKTTVYSSSRATRVQAHPGSPGGIVNVVEANVPHLQTPTSMGIYDIIRLSTEATFYGNVPAAAPRMIRHDDQRHINRTTLLFFDMHAEARPITPQDLPVRLLNPLDNH